MEDKEFTVDDQGTQKVLRDCTEDERQYILDTGWDIVARESPHSAKLERSREWASQMKEHTTDEKE